MSDDKLDEVLRSAQATSSQSPLQQVEPAQAVSTAHTTIISPKKGLTLRQQVRLTKKTFKSAGYLATLEIKRVSDAQIQLHLLVYHLNTKKNGKIAGEGTLILPNTDPKFADAEYVAAVNFGEADSLGAKFNSMLSGNVGGLIQNVFTIINQVKFGS